MLSLKKILPGIFILLVVVLFGMGFNSQTLIPSVIKNGDVSYLSNTLVFKLKHLPSNGIKSTTDLPGELKKVLSQFNVTASRSIFNQKLTEREFGLDRIVIITFESDTDPFYVSSKIKNLSDVEWAEPKFVYELDFIPNDPEYASMYNLSKIQASLAWDVTQGDTSVVIGIVDTGVDWDHPDLAANIWRNWDEIPGNGIDDDNNGFIDDIRGWDFGGLTGTPDNNPMEDRPDHGTHVAGISSAVTNNGIGIASIGFKSRLMAIKTIRDDVRGPNGPSVLFGYEGIVYAVDNGAKIINCSWGGSGYSIFGQEIVNYATSNGALVVAAAGNSGGESSHFPSGYDNVLSVASTTSGDIKSSFSTYGTTVDVSAPGSTIYSTWQNDTYTFISGTSMASPLTAGLAALVAAEFPSYTPLQIGERIRVTSDNIDALNSPSLQYKIGKGRINALTSLTAETPISVRATDVAFSDEAPYGNGDGIFQANETIVVDVNFINYLSATSNLSVTLQLKNSYSSIVSGNFSAGSVPTMGEFNNSSSRFTFTLNASVPANAKLDFLLMYNDGSYSDYQWISTIGNPTYGTQSGNDVAMTITSKGTLGYNDYPTNAQGNGFSYQGGDNLLFEGALILGTSNTTISDAARGSNQSIQNNDFAIVQPFILHIPGTVADYEGSSIVNDNNAGSNKLGVTVKLNSYSYSSSPNENYMILRYKIINNNATDITNLHTGLFFDWDFATATADQAGWDDTGKFGYAYRPAGSPDTRVAAGVINSTAYNFYAIKNDSADGGFGIYDGFADHEKWTAISTGLSKTNAGPGDISFVVADGPKTIAAGDSIEVVFTVAAAPTVEELRTAMDNSKIKYNQILTSVEDNVSVPVEFNVSQNYPNPFNPSTNINFSLPVSSFVTTEIFNALGEKVAVPVNGNYSAGKHQFVFNASSLPSGVYFYRVTAEGVNGIKNSSINKMLLLK
ncbi:MAG: S8 family serine peptidase [Ignavibacteriales bacterium]|nr:MAG: S8 family serine peptidase [Ignavibacteriales bacterium]